MLDPVLESILEQGMELQGLAQHDLALVHYSKHINYYKDNFLFYLYIDIEYAWCLEAKGDFEESNEKFLQLLENAIVISDDSDDILIKRAIINIYHGLSLIENRLENIESSFLWSQKSLVESLGINDKVLIAKSNYYLALSHYYSGKLDRVFQLLQESLPHLQDIKHRRIYGKVLNLLAVAYQLTGSLDLSLDFFNQALRIYEDLHDITQIPLVLNNMSVNYKLKGEYTISLRLLKKVEWMEIDWLLLYHVLDNIAEIQLFTGELSEARKTAQNLVHLARDHHLQNLIGKAIGLLAYIEQYNDLLTARAFFEEAIELLSTSEIEMDLYVVVNRYTRFLIRIKDYELVEKLLNKYEKVLDEKSITIHNADIKLTRGLYEREKNINLGLAKQYYLEGLRLANEKQLNLSKVKAYIYLAENALESFQIKGDLSYISEASEYISNGYELANASNQYPDISSINLVRALLAQFKGNIDESIKIIDETLELVNEKGLRLQEAQARALKIKFNEQKSLMYRTPAKLKTDSLELLNDKENLYSSLDKFSGFDSTSALLNTIRIFFHDDFSKFMPAEPEVSIVVFVLSTMGPIPKVEDLSDYLTKFESQSKNSIEEILMLMGTSFSLAVGQGNYYQTGLFGPLPVPRLPGKNAIIFSSKIKDIDQDLKGDQRYEDNLNFGYACLIYPKEFDTIFFEREKLELEFEYLLNNIQVMKNKEKLKEWKSNLLKVVQSQFVPQS